ncbi:MAG: hypothetical protein K8R90_09620 [Candidatus Cloacimonetes bacterium]|nr:hypothetical protein [Candidatus Cloacimonadota bacterium]
MVRVTEIVHQMPKKRRFVSENEAMKKLVAEVTWPTLQELEQTILDAEELWRQVCEMEQDNPPPELPELKEQVLGRLIPAWLAAEDLMQISRRILMQTDTPGWKAGKSLGLALKVCPKLLGTLWHDLQLSQAMPTSDLYPLSCWLEANAAGSTMRAKLLSKSLGDF